MVYKLFHWQLYEIYHMNDMSSSIVENRYLYVFHLADKVHYKMIEALLMFQTNEKVHGCIETIAVIVHWYELYVEV